MFFSLCKRLAVPLVLAGAGSLLYAGRRETRSFRLESLNLTTYGGNVNAETDPDWRSKPLKILHLSDLHLCYPEAEKVEFLQEVTSHDYDLVLLTGDVFENYSGMAYARSILSRAPRLGAYAVLGNHDYYNYSMVNRALGRIVRKVRHPQVKRNVEPMIKALELGGFKVLRHQSVRLPDDGIHIVGIDYPGLTKSEIKRLVGEAPDGHLRLVLFHVPRNLSDISDSGAHLAVGGHTHGGQIRIPGWGALITDSELPTTMASGHFNIEQTAFHISRGLGADPRTNIRLFCPPAATVINVTHYLGTPPAPGNPT